MNMLAKINHRRMTVMRAMAKNIGGKQSGEASIEQNKVKRVLISRPNGRLGNLLLITPLLQEIEATFPEAKIDLFVKGGLAPVLFRNYKNVVRTIQLPKKPFSNLLKYVYAWLSLKRYRYDLVINAVNYSSSGRLSTRFATAAHKFFGDADESIKTKYIDYKHIAKAVVYNLRNYLSSVSLPESNRPIAPLDLRLSKLEIEEGKAALSQLTGNDRKTIALFTYATGKKCYPAAWWELFYERLMTEYSEYNIIEVLPIENVSQISFRAPCFYSSDVRKIGALIANTSIFIGADSGIMHLASASGAPTIGLFSVSNPHVYQPYNKGSVAVDTRITDMESIMMAIDTAIVENTANTQERLTACGYQSSVSSICLR